ncbi:MAG: hypothetical protein IJ058_05815 [Lachnospiraceae bacterium]|nr:hypothetical protein [Lachnospiraceae bacterium]
MKSLCNEVTGTCTVASRLKAYLLIACLLGACLLTSCASSDEIREARIEKYEEFADYVELPDRYYSDYDDYDDYEYDIPLRLIKYRIRKAKKESMQAEREESRKKRD